MQAGQFGRQRRLISHTAWHPPHQARHFRPRLHKTKDVVDQQEHILFTVIAKPFGHGQRRLTDQKTHTGRRVHLPEQHDHLVAHTRLAHLAPKLFGLTRPLADTTEQANTVMMLKRVVNELTEKNGLADPCTTEQTGLATSFDRRQQVDCLNPGLQHFCAQDPL